MAYPGTLPMFADSRISKIITAFPDIGIVLTQKHWTRQICGLSIATWQLGQCPLEGARRAFQRPSETIDPDIHRELPLQAIAPSRKVAGGNIPGQVDAGKAFRFRASTGVSSDDPQ